MRDFIKDSINLNRRLLFIDCGKDPLKTLEEIAEIEKEYTDYTFKHEYDRTFNFITVRIAEKGE